MDQWSAMINVADRGRGNIGQVSMAVPPSKAARRHSPGRNEIVWCDETLSLWPLEMFTGAHRTLSWLEDERFLACLLCEFCPCKVQTPICCLNSEFKRDLLALRALTQRPHARKPIYVTKSTKKSPEQVVSSFAPRVLYIRDFIEISHRSNISSRRARGAVLRKFRHWANCWRAFAKHPAAHFP